MRPRPEFAELLDPRTRHVCQHFLADPDSGFEMDFDERPHGAGNSSSTASRCGIWNGPNSLCP